MIEIIINLISNVIDLLDDCGWPKQADWYRDRREKLIGAGSDRDKLGEQLRKIDRSLAGMGSFSDIPLNPKRGKRTDLEADKEQWRLAAELGDAIEEWFSDSRQSGKTGT